MNNIKSIVNNDLGNYLQSMKRIDNENYLGLVPLVS